MILVDVNLFYRFHRRQEIPIQGVAAVERGGGEGAKYYKAIELGQRNWVMAKSFFSGAVIEIRLRD